MVYDVVNQGLVPSRFMTW